MAISISKPTVGGSQDTWGQQINDALDIIVNGVNGVGTGVTAPNLEEGGFKIGGVTVTTSAAEINVLDGIASTLESSELNLLDGATPNTVVNGKCVVYGSLGELTATTFNCPTITSTTVNAGTVDLGDWTVTESGGSLYFATGGVNKMKLDASGNATFTGDVTAFGTIT